MNCVRGEDKHHHLYGMNGVNDGFAIGRAATMSRGAIQQRMPADSSRAQTALATRLSFDE